VEQKAYAFKQKRGLGFSKFCISCWFIISGIFFFKHSIAVELEPPPTKLHTDEHWRASEQASVLLFFPLTLLSGILQAFPPPPCQCLRDKKI
jgi:hypothetical protein